jgi:hypothetical protein
MMIQLVIPTIICLAPASTQMSANNGAEAATAVRGSFTSVLTGPTLTVAALNSRLTTQAREEAKQSRCEYVLFVTLKQERKKKGGGLLGKIASEAAQQGAWSVAAGTTSTVGRVAASAVASAAAEASANMAASTKVRDELELTYRLESNTGQVIAQKSAKRKARADGEDLLTPLVEHASEQIATAVAK